MILSVKETRDSILIARRNKRHGIVNASPSISLEERLTSAAKDLFQKALSRPFVFIAQEAIVQFSAAYNGFLYGLTFLFNSAFVIVFGAEGFGFDTSQTGFCFAGVVIGIALGAITNAVFQERCYQKQLVKAKSSNVPEARVMLGQIAGIKLPISMFWFAWTSYPSIHWIMPILATGLWGWSFYTLILMTFVYSEDAYKTYSASALAGISLIRNLVGAGFPLFGRQMYHKLGNQRATSLLAGLAVLLIPIQFILKQYGVRLRLKSPWARQHVEESHRARAIRKESAKSSEEM